MIRFTRDLLLGLTLMAAGYTLTRIGRWMQQVPVRPQPIPRRPIDVYDVMFMSNERKPSRERWN